MSADVPEFREACAQFQAFLASQGISGTLLWVFREDMSSHKRVLRVKCPLAADNAACAGLVYELGRQRGLGVWLNVVGLLNGQPLCFVWVPADEEDASYAMLSGLKLSVPTEPRATQAITGSFRWWVQCWFDRRLGYTGLADQLPLKAAVT